MGWDGAGQYTRVHNFSADASAGIKILAARVDAEFNDFASAMTLVVTRDGQNAPTANLPMGGFRHVGVGAPMSATNYMRSKDFIENVPIYMVDAESSADRISVSASFYTTASAATAPRDGSHILVKAGSDKSSAVAIRLNTGDGNPHSANVILANGSALYSGAIRSGGIYEFLWSSSDTAWQLFNPQVDYATSAYPGVILLATAAEVAAGTDIPHAVTPSQLASKFSASYATTASAGLVELATTAEISVGTNVSAVITPSVLHSYVSAATTASAGMLEIATTAEVSTGTDASRAVTPAALANVHARPYVATFKLNAASAGMMYSNDRAALWTVSVVRSSQYEIIHNLGLSAPQELNITIGFYSDTANANRAIISSASASSFNVWVVTNSGSVWEFLSTNLHIQAFRLT